MFNKGKIEDLNVEILKLNEEITKLNTTVESLSKFGAMGVLEIKEEISKFEQNKSTLTEELLTLRKEILETKESLIETQEIAMLQEVGVYQYTSILDTSEGYSEKIAEIRSSIKERNITNGGAIRAAQGWTVNGSTADGAKMVKDIEKMDPLLNTLVVIKIG